MKNGCKGPWQYRREACIDLCGNMDLGRINLFNGCKIRALTVVHNWSSEHLAIYVDQAIKGQDVVTVMKRLSLFKNHCPKLIQLNTLDN